MGTIAYVAIKTDKRPLIKGLKDFDAFQAFAHEKLNTDDYKIFAPSDLAKAEQFLNQHKDYEGLRYTIS